MIFINSQTSSSFTYFFSAIEGADEYEVYRAYLPTPSSPAVFDLITTHLVAGEYTDTGLNSNSIYQYYIKAIASYSETKSNTVTIRTDSETPTIVVSEITTQGYSFDVVADESYSVEGNDGTGWHEIATGERTTGETITKIWSTSSVFKTPRDLDLRVIAHGLTSDIATLTYPLEEVLSSELASVGTVTKNLELSNYVNHVSQVWVKVNLVTDYFYSIGTSLLLDPPKHSMEGSHISLHNPDGSITIDTLSSTPIVCDDQNENTDFSLYFNFKVPSDGVYYVLIGTDGFSDLLDYGLIKFSISHLSE